MPENRKSRVRWALILRVTVLLLINLFPFYWMFLTSIKPGTELFTNPPTVITTTPTFDAYWRLLETTNFLQYAKNSLIISVGATILCVAVSTLGAYAVTRFTFPGSELFSTTVLYAYAFAPIVIVVPLYSMFRDWGLINSYAGMILAYASFGLPLCMWMLRPFFDAISLQLEEAAFIDGASRPKSFFYVVLPQAVPGIVAVSVFTFLLAWEDYLFARVLITRDDMKTLPIALHDLNNASLIDWPLAMSGAVLITLPVIFGFLFFQRYLVAGWGAGAVK